MFISRHEYENMKEALERSQAHGDRLLEALQTERKKFSESFQRNDKEWRDICDREAARHGEAKKELYSKLDNRNREIVELKSELRTLKQAISDKEYADLLAQYSVGDRYVIYLADCSKKAAATIMEISLDRQSVRVVFDETVCSLSENSAGRMLEEEDELWLDMNYFHHSTRGKLLPVVLFSDAGPCPAAVPKKAKKVRKTKKEREAVQS